MSANCESCVQLADQNHALQARAQKEFEKREALVDQLADAQRKIAALKGQLTKLRVDSPKMADAEEVFRFWQQRLGKNARTTFGPERQKKVLARLGEKSLSADGDRKDDLKWAVRGCEALPFVGSKGRQAKPSSEAKRHDDLTLICRDETTVERFIGYANEHADFVFARFLMALGQEFGRERLDPVMDGTEPIMAVAVCPVCLIDWALTVIPGRACFGEVLVLRCHRRGCKPDDVRAALRGAVKPQLAVAA